MKKTISSTTKLVMTMLMVVVSLIARAVPVQPDMIDFNVTSTNGGVLFWDPLTNRLVGSNIAIDTFAAMSLPDMTHVPGTPASCVGCVLSFISGTHTIGNNFGGGLGGSAIVISSSAFPGGFLMAGQFTNGDVLNLAGPYRLFGAGFLDVKNPLLTTDILGFPVDAPIWLGGLNLQFVSPAGFGPGSVSRVISGDVTNIPVVPQSEVPVPAAAWLFGTGLIGLAGVVRRGVDA